jgi:hypothetical protein
MPKPEDFPHLEPGRYRHFKKDPASIGVDTTYEYTVLGVSCHTETGVFEVVYIPLYGPLKGRLAHRPYTMFTETVTRDSYSGPRFTYIGPA